MLTLTGKAANTAKTIAGGGSFGRPLGELTRPSPGERFIANLGSVAGAAAADHPTARIAQLSEPTLWTASNGTLSKSPISSTGSTRSRSRRAATCRRQRPDDERRYPRLGGTEPEEFFRSGC